MRISTRLIPTAYPDRIIPTGLSKLEYINKNLNTSLTRTKSTTFAVHNKKQRPLTTFEQLGISEEILKVLNEMGFEHPTEIQEKVIPQLLQEARDCIGIAQTGTGKTAAFGLPLLECVIPEQKHTQALILAPTRELGQQIAEQLFKFSKYMPKMNVLAVYGGTNIMNQIKDLRKPQHIIIATPGRLRDLIGRKAVDLSQLAYIVLDEADEMLNMGFKEELDDILSYIPKEKNTWLFSATMPPPIKRIVDTYMNQPIEIKIDAKHKVNPNIDHQYAILKGRDKTEALKRFLDIAPDMRGVVFCRTKRDTQELAEELLSLNYKADALHGDMSQHLRTRVMKRFKDHDLQVLIATDVAARGIDVNDLTHVFHYALPDDNSYYTHRSGRTARAGKKGISLCFVSGREVHKIRNLERQLGIEFTKALVPNNEDIVELRLENWCKGLTERPLGEKPDLDLLNKVNLLFGDLSKEELLQKLMEIEIERLNISGSYDLNEKESSGGGGGGGRDRGRRTRSRGRKDSERKDGDGYGKKRGYPRSSDKNSSGGSRRPSNFKAKPKSEGGVGSDRKSSSENSGSGKKNYGSQGGGSGSSGKSYGNSGGGSGKKKSGVNRKKRY